MNVSIGTILQNTIIEGLRKLKILRFGNDDANNAYQAADFGSDFSPPKDWTAIYAKTANDSEPVVIGFVNQLANEALDVGDKELFSTNEGGSAKSFSVLLKNDRTIEIGGGDDYAVGFNQLQTQFNELNDKFNKSTEAFNIHTHPTAATGPISPPTPVPSKIPVIPSLADISLTKKENIKLQ
jgi:hypothetical protein